MGGRVIPIGSAILVLFAIIMAGKDFGSIGLAMEDTQRGCPSCHAGLSERLPQGHPPVEGEGVKSCPGCHAAKGSATPLEWIAHFKHYSAAGFPGDCWSCHLIDPTGNFRPYDLEVPGVKVGKEEVGQLVPYYKSWGASNHLDHRHALKRISCGDCHGAPIPKEAVSMERCQGCHGSYNQLAQKTPVHASGLYSHFSDQEVGCDSCHKVHGESSLVCSQCHTFDQKVP